MNEAADVARAISSFSDEDAAARPSGVRRVKPVIVENEEEETGEAALQVSEPTETRDEHQTDPSLDPVRVEAEHGFAETAGDQAGPVAGDEVILHPGEEAAAGAATQLEAPEQAGETDVRLGYQDPEFLTPKEMSSMCCTLGVQIHLSYFQKIKDAALKGGIEEAAKAMTLCFDPDLVMEIFDVATEATNAQRNMMEISRRRMRLHMDSMQVADGAITGGVQE